MQKIKIETAQNVDIEYEVASIGDRVLAELIDLLIMFGYLIASVFILSFLQAVLGPAGLYYGVAFVVVLYVPIFLYDFLCETFMDGQSFGKKARKIKVVKMDGSRPTIGSYLLRWLIKPIDVYMTYGSVGIVTMFINGKGQRLGDLAANTTVIKMKSVVRLEDTILSNIPDNYELKFPQVSFLTDRDIRIIRDVININNRKMDFYLYENVLARTKEVISKKIGVNSDIRPIYFLNMVLKDYNYLNSE